MTSRGRRLAGEIWRYLAVGLGATVVAVFLFNWLVHGIGMADSAPLNGHPILGYVLANLVGTAISYRGTRWWAFRHRTTTHVDGGRTAFVAISVVTMAIPMACLSISRNLLGLDDPFSDNISANVIGLAFANAARFVLTRQYVFGVHEEAEVLDRV
ncbi:MAG: GtrA family protein [Nocardioides sp.]|uniref:GtrA family protein n=1 Tax=Nocardioides sp. TaxID=35761 RepID=UPI00260B72A1|nr:GtrA family protein [Nocardioides sp.]MCW2835451.1 GtrA family protein [Nocardioides sp.]